MKNQTNNFPEENVSQVQSKAFRIARKEKTDMTESQKRNLRTYLDSKDIDGHLGRKLSLLETKAFRSYFIGSIKN